MLYLAVFSCATVAKARPFVKAWLSGFVRNGKNRRAIAGLERVNVPRVLSEYLLDTDELCTLDAIYRRVCYDGFVLGVGEDEKDSMPIWKNSAFVAPWVSSEK